MRLRRSSLRVLTSSAPRLSWCTALTPMAQCAWSKNFGAPVDKPSMFHFISWKTEFEISGRGEGQVKSKKVKGKRKDFAPSFAFLLFPFALIGGGQGRNRTADAGLFRAALYQLSYLAEARKTLQYRN